MIMLILLCIDVGFDAMVAVLIAYTTLSSLSIRAAS